MDTLALDVYKRQIEDNVIIYAGASILGGETVIGRGAVIGSNAFITSSIEPGARVSIKNQELSIRTGAVSYTHLDVYKRQLSGRQLNMQIIINNRQEHIIWTGNLTSYMQFRASEHHF